MPPTDADGPRPADKSRFAWGPRGWDVAISAGFVLVLSSGYLVGSIGTQSAPPLALLFWRFLIGLVVLGIIAFVTRAPWPRDPRVWMHLLVIGVLLQAVQLGALYIGLGLGVSAGLASLVINICPLLVAAAAAPLFSERLSGRQWLGLALGLVGVSVSLSEQLGGAAHLVGYAFTGLALLGFAGGTLYQKRFGQTVDLRTGTTIQLLGATVASLPLAAAHGGLALPLTTSVVGSVAWLATVNSIGSFILFFVLLRRRSGGAATSLLYLVPPVTALLGVPLLGQSVGVSVVLGMAVSGVGVVLVIARQRRPQPDRSFVRDDPAPDPKPTAAREKARCR